MVYDLIIRGGLVVDGTGASPTMAEVGVRDGRIATVAAAIEGDAVEVIDAAGCIITPGFVDIHTHFDGQATWDPLLEPSTPHGVTTVVAGNCGVGFAPVRRGSEQSLIDLMEGVEDIPGAALAEGLSWNWETFPDYLEVLAAGRWAADIGVQVAHGPVRSYVMGERAATREAATGEEIAAMSRIVSEAIEAGALGFTTSRTLGHTALDGTPVPGTFAARDELFALGRAVRDGGGGIFEVAGAGIAPTDDPDVVATEMDWIGALAKETGLTTTFIVLQENHAPTRWRDDLERAAAWRAQGANVVPLVAGRPFGVLLGWDIRHPFRGRPTYEAIADLPPVERLAALGQPDTRAAILDETAAGPADVITVQGFVSAILPMCFVLGDDPDYEQHADLALGQLAKAEQTTVDAVAYNAMLDGSMLLFNMFNYTDGDHAAIYEQMADPVAVVGLNDAGAHCGAICDASIPTYMLTHWSRDRTRGPRLELPDVVRRLTSQPAELYGLNDRGRVLEGLRADLNVIDLDHLRLHAPYTAHDLPAGGTRILQRATGYRVTVVAGEVTRRAGVDTGARPGRLVRCPIAAA